uniref:Uncharacterized protein n=1 Tax=viral metagenome TaxID=1070528 RepID=A0A6C0JNH6_9ZZZZ
MTTTMHNFKKEKNMYDKINKKYNLILYEY